MVASLILAPTSASQVAAWAAPAASSAPAATVRDRVQRETVMPDDSRLFGSDVRDGNGAGARGDLRDHAVVGLAIQGIEDDQRQRDQAADERPPEHHRLDAG